MKEKNIEKSKKTNGKTLRLILNIFVFTVIGVFALFGISSMIDKATKYNFPLFGLRSSVIVSDSMSFINDANKSYLDDNTELIYKFDVVTTKKYKSFDEIEKYDVLTYYSENGLICHRVIDKYESNGKKFVVTRGDANSTNDSPFEFSLVRGKVIKVTHGTGKFVLFFQSPYFFIAVFGTGFFVFLGLFIFDLKKEKVTVPKHKEDKNSEPETKKKTKPEKNKVKEDKTNT